MSRYYIERDHSQPEKKYWLMPNGEWMVSTEIFDDDLQVKSWARFGDAINAARKLHQKECGIHDIRVMS